MMEATKYVKWYNWYLVMEDMGELMSRRGSPALAAGQVECRYSIDRMPFAIAYPPTTSRS